MFIHVLRLARGAFALFWLAATVGLIGLAALPHMLPLLDRELYIVRGSSMEPSIPLGAAVIVAPAGGEPVATGDVITFRGSNQTVVTHRVVAVEQGHPPSFWTKGDAGAATDPLIVPASSVIGVVEYSIPWSGRILGLLGSGPGTLAALGLLGGLLLIIWFLDGLLASVRETSHRRTAVAEPAG
jgi:signal peptidase I